MTNKIEEKNKNFTTTIEAITRHGANCYDAGFDDCLKQVEKENLKEMRNMEFAYQKGKQDRTEEIKRMIGEMATEYGMDIPAKILLDKVKEMK